MTLLHHSSLMSVICVNCKQHSFTLFNCLMQQVVSAYSFLLFIKVTTLSIKLFAQLVQQFFHSVRHDWIWLGASQLPVFQSVRYVTTHLCLWLALHLSWGSERCEHGIQHQHLYSYSFMVKWTLNGLHTTLRLDIL